MKAAPIKVSRFSEGLTVFKPDYYLNEGKKVITDLLDKGISYASLKSLSNKLYQGGIFKRVFVENETKALKYLTASDVQRSSPLESSKNISKKYTPWIEEMTLRNGQILVSCAGTGSCGKTALVNLSFAGNIGSQEIIRVETNKIPHGYLYAYLSTPLIYQYIQSMTYGAAIPRISPDELGNLPILLPSESFQKEIHNLIQAASKLREDGIKLIKSSIADFEEKLPSIQFQKIYTAKIGSRINHSSRLEATYHSKAIESFYLELENQKIQTRTIANLSELVFTPGIFKRLRTENAENGIPFLSGSDLLNQFPSFQSHLSRKMKNIDDYILKDGWLAIQDAGSIGYVTYVHKFLNGVSATNNLVRIVPKESENYNYYIYCFLKTSIGQKLLKTLEYGSVQKHIDNKQVSNLRVPIIPSVFDSITSTLKMAMDNLGSACIMENNAINKIEKQIESWQKS